VAEITIKTSLNKMNFDADLIACARRIGFEFLSFSAHDAIKLKDLPFHHRNSFDRLLIAQSLTQKLTFMTNDPLIHRYGCNLI